jgi:hypothetical protein
MGDRWMRIGMEQLGLLDSKAFQTAREGDSHPSMKEIGTIFFRISKEDCKVPDGQPPVKLVIMNR